ncbi:MAG: hypothetical protein K6F99_10340 [Lachnospiraceae bacterium]|nr:hypothetical protein [Lachnospiraceae bacterium]
MGLKYIYSGIEEDIKKVLDAVDLDQLAEFREYMNGKANEKNDNKEKTKAAKEVFELLDYTLKYMDLDFKADLRANLPVIETIAGYRRKEMMENTPPAYFEDENRISDRVGRLESVIRSYAGKLSSALDVYIKAAGFDELSANKTVQDMFQSFEGISSLSQRMSTWETKNDQMLLAGSIWNIENKRGNIHLRLNDIVEKNNGKSWDTKNEIKKKREEKYAESKKAYDKISSNDTKEEYKDSAKLFYQEYLAAVEDERIIRDKINESNTIIGEDNIGIAKIQNFKDEEERLAEKRKLYETNYLKRDMVAYGKADENLTFYKKKYKTTMEDLLKDKRYEGKKSMMVDYYNVRRKYEKMKYTKKAFKEFLEKTKDNTWGQRLYFESASKRKIYERFADPQIVKNGGNPEITRLVNEYREALEDAFALYPDKDKEQFLKNNTDKSLEEYTKELMEQLDQKVTEARDAFLKNDNGALRNIVDKYVIDINRRRELELKTYEDQIQGVNLSAEQWYEDLYENQMRKIGYIGQTEILSYQKLYELYQGNEKQMKCRMQKDFELASMRNNRYEAQLKYLKSNKKYKDGTQKKSVNEVYYSKYFDTEAVDMIIDGEINGAVKLKQYMDEKRAAQEAVDYDKWLINNIKETIVDNRFNTYKLTGDVRMKTVAMRKGRVTDEDYEKYMNDLRDSIANDYKSGKSKNFYNDVKKDLLFDIKNEEDKIVGYRKDEEEVGVIKLNSIEKSTRFSMKNLYEKIDKARVEMNTDKEKAEESESDIKTMEGIYNDYNSYRSDLGRVYDDFNERNINNVVLAKGIREKAGYFYEKRFNAKKPSHDDTSEYKAIYEKLEKLMGMSDDLEVDKMSTEIGELNDIATRYLQEKSREWRPFPSNQRIYRINYAKSIQVFCKNQKAILADSGVGVSGVNARFLKKAGEMSKDTFQPNKEEFFRKDFLTEHPNALKSILKEQEKKEISSFMVNTGQPELNNTFKNKEEQMNAQPVFDIQENKKDILTDPQ